MWGDLFGMFAPLFGGDAMGKEELLKKLRLADFATAFFRPHMDRATQ